MSCRVMWLWRQEHHGASREIDIEIDEELGMRTGSVSQSVSQSVNEKTLPRRKEANSLSSPRGAIFSAVFVGQAQHQTHGAESTHSLNNQGPPEAAQHSLTLLQLLKDDANSHVMAVCPT